MTYREDHEDVYVEREGTSIGTILGVIVAIVVVLAIIWFFFLGGMNPGTTNPNQDNPNPIQQQQPDNGGNPGPAAPPNNF